MMGMPLFATWLAAQAGLLAYGPMVEWITGAEAGNAPGRWALRDVYPGDAEPLFWRTVYEPQMRYLDWPPATVGAPP